MAWAEKEAPVEAPAPADPKGTTTPRDSAQGEPQEATVGQVVTAVVAAVDRPSVSSAAPEPPSIKAT